MNEPTLSCAAGCKRTVADIDAALAAGWGHLPIQNRWRCPTCTRELMTASTEVRDEPQ